MSDDFLSLSVVEDNYEQAKWKMAERFTHKAELLYSNKDHVGAYQLCQKVLDAAPFYVPAKQLMMKCTKNGETSGGDEQELQPVHDAGLEPPSLELDSDLDDTLESLPRDTQKKTVQFVEEEDELELTLLPESFSNAEDYPEPSGPQKVHSNKPAANKLDRRGRREKYVRELLLEGHFFQKQPYEVFQALKELFWSEEMAAYVCPVPSCKNLQFKTRVLCINHFVAAHLETDSSGVKVHPFSCKTCKKNLTRFRTLQELMKHGRLEHPRCQWMEPLVTAINKDNN